MFPGILQTAKLLIRVRGKKEPQHFGHVKYQINIYLYFNIRYEATDAM